MDFKIPSVETVLRKLPKLENKGNLILILINGVSLLISVINAHTVEKNFTKLFIL